MMAKKKGQRVVQSNSLTSASYRLTLTEQQVLMLAIAKLPEHPNATEKTPFTVTATEMIEMFGTDSAFAYNLLREAVDRLVARVGMIDRPDPDIPALDYTRTHWVSAADYFQGEGRVVLFFSHKLLPYLTDLVREFTLIHVQQTRKMTSIYAVRIYALLCQWRSCGEWEVTLDWLREKFELPESYQNINDLKKRVITPAVVQINEHSDLWVKYHQRKRGRVVVALNFLFGEKLLAAPQPPPKAKRLTRAEIERQARPGETWEEAERRLRSKRG